jgi:hypothetical protein
MSKKLPRAASTYRAARRNKCKAEHLVWNSTDWLTREVEAPKYRPATARGSSAYRTFNGVVYPQKRLPPRTYKPNGEREVARRLARAA